MMMMMVEGEECFFHILGVIKGLFVLRCWRFLGREVCYLRV